jgi:hypothetical protein
VNHSFELDFPLFVDGDLIIQGNLLLTQENTPLIVLGDLLANHLIYKLYMDNHGPHLFVSGKTLLKGYAFIEGKTDTFDHDLVSKATFSLNTTDIYSAVSRDFLSLNQRRTASQPQLLPFPNSPTFVRPGILNNSVELDEKTLERYLLKNIEPFTTSYPAIDQETPWRNFFKQWQAICRDSFKFPELAGAKWLEHLRPDIFSPKQRKSLTDQKIISICVLADLRTGLGFCKHDGSYIVDPVALNKTLDDDTPIHSAPVNAENYPSTCDLVYRYKDVFGSLLFGDLDNAYSEQTIHLNGKYYLSLYEREREYLANDPYLTIYWLLYFGLLFDERYQEVLKIAQQHDHELVIGAIHFFEDNAYQESAAAYVDYDLDNERQLFRSDGQLVIASGNEAFRRFHSDYIYTYYHENKIHTKNTVSALCYAINNDFSDKALEKSLLLVETAQDYNLWEHVTIPEQPEHNAFAWKYVRLHHPKSKGSHDQLESWINSLINLKEISARTRIKSLKLLARLSYGSELINRAANMIQQQESDHEIETYD